MTQSKTATVGHVTVTVPMSNVALGILLFILLVITVIAWLVQVAVGVPSAWQYFFAGIVADETIGNLSAGVSFVLLFLFVALGVMVAQDRARGHSDRTFENMTMLVAVCLFMSAATSWLAYSHYSTLAAIGVITCVLGHFVLGLRSVLN